MNASRQFWLFSDYGVNCHFLLSRTRLDRSPFLDKCETAQTFEDMENFVFRIANIAYVLVKVLCYLCEAVYVHVHFAQYLSSSFGVNKSVMKWKSILRIH